MSNQTLKVKGMHCASCSAIITKKISKIDGVDSINVNFATEKAQIKFDDAKISVSNMNKEIEPLGYSFVEEMDQDMDHRDHAGMNDTKEQKESEILEMRSKMQFVLPISLFIFILMMWDIAAKFWSFMPILPIPMDVFNIISMVLATIVLFWIG
ncbi:MAG: cation-translocating P-type ATPase, partial [Candidatus Pacebacteria bacterium]|nr:cation-translocating P-type ATPase [Candidatus Paceibacterota bacterium]